MSLTHVLIHLTEHVQCPSLRQTHGTPPHPSSVPTPTGLAERVDLCQGQCANPAISLVPLPPIPLLCHVPTKSRILRCQKCDLGMYVTQTHICT